MAPAVLFVQPGSEPNLMVRRSRPDLLVQTAYLLDLYAEHLEPGQQPVQGRLIGQRAVHDRLHRFHGGSQVLEVKEGLRRENARNADLVT